MTGGAIGITLGLGFMAVTVVAASVLSERVPAMVEALVDRSGPCRTSRQRSPSSI